MDSLIKSLESSLIVSCQAPMDSPLHQPEMIAAIAKSCVHHGIKCVRIDSPNHIKAVRKLLPNVIIIGLWKQMNLDSEVYITPRFEDAVAVGEAGADIIAIDVTNRLRPNYENIADIIPNIKQKLGKLVMADIDNLENALLAAKLDADLIGTTLYGYTKQTKHLLPPAFDLLIEMREKTTKPLICEGGISNPEEAKKALELGAFAVVVGTAITGIDLKVQAFQKVF